MLYPHFGNIGNMKFAFHKTPIQQYGYNINQVHFNEMLKHPQSIPKFLDPLFNRPPSPLQRVPINQQQRLQCKINISYPHYYLCTTAIPITSINNIDYEYLRKAYGEILEQYNNKDMPYFITSNENQHNLIPELIESTHISINEVYNQYINQQSMQHNNDINEIPIKDIMEKLNKEHHEMLTNMFVTFIEAQLLIYTINHSKIKKDNLDQRFSWPPKMYNNIPFLFPNSFYEETNDKHEQCVQDLVYHELQELLQQATNTAQIVSIATSHHKLNTEYNEYMKNRTLKFDTTLQNHLTEIQHLKIKQLHPLMIRMIEISYNFMLYLSSYKSLITAIERLQDYIDTILLSFNMVSIQLNIIDGYSHKLKMSDSAYEKYNQNVNRVLHRQHNIHLQQISKKQINTSQDNNDIFKLGNLFGTSLNEQETIMQMIKLGSKRKNTGIANRLKMLCKHVNI